MNVLIADDSELMRNRLMSAISALEGIQVVGEAVDCCQAVEAVEKLHPDVVILDIRMPGGSGIEVLNTVKSQKSSPIVIMLTNYAYPQYQSKCLESGADYFFDKSSDFGKVPALLKKLAASFD
ncbi:MAG: response regulator transcription factor [Candidatus Glassbacteria bacterium]|nr:response regulator transcription factor [Candidatus Glassbacteria bacterium]